MKLYRLRIEDIDNLSSMETLCANYAHDAFMAGDMEASEYWDKRELECINLLSNMVGMNQAEGKNWARIKEISAERATIRDYRIAMAHVPA